MADAAAVPIAEGAPAVGRLYLKVKGGRIHIFENARIGQPLGAFSDRLREKELSVRSILYGPLTDDQWKAFKNIPGSEDAYLYGNHRPKPADEEETVIVANMRLLVVPPEDKYDLLARRVEELSTRIEAWMNRPPPQPVLPLHKPMSNASGRDLAIKMASCRRFLPAMPAPKHDAAWPSDAELEQIYRPPAGANNDALARHLNKFLQPRGFYALPAASVELSTSYWDGSNTIILTSHADGFIFKMPVHERWAGAMFAAATAAGGSPIRLPTVARDEWLDAVGVIRWKEPGEHAAAESYEVQCEAISCVERTGKPFVGFMTDLQGFAHVCRCDSLRQGPTLTCFYGQGADPDFLTVSRGLQQLVAELQKSVSSSEGPGSRAMGVHAKGSLREGEQEEEEPVSGFSEEAVGSATGLVVLGSRPGPLSAEEAAAYAEQEELERAHEGNVVEVSPELMQHLLSGVPLENVRVVKTTF